MTENKTDMQEILTEPAVSDEIPESVTDNLSETAEENAEIVGADADILEKQPDIAENDTEEQKACFENCTVSDLYELSEQFPEENVVQDVISESFRLFAKDRKGTPSKIYSEYLNLRRSFEKRMAETTPARGLSGQEKNTRAYSGFDGAGIHRNASAGLTKRQMQIARESGMSFREYAELLDSVPHGRNL